VTNYAINAQMRTLTGKKVSQLRRQDIVPGTLYGPKNDPLSVQFNRRELENTLRQAGGTHLVDVNVDNKVVPAIAREVQRDVIRGDILHVDFFVVDMAVRIRAEIPVVLVGESPLVASRRGIMITGPHALTIETLPARLSDHITIDVSNLSEIGATISVKDLNLGADVTIINDPDEMIVRIVQPSAARSQEQSESGGEG
jgi:large subunit ribosomal protein L25